MKFRSLHFPSALHIQTFLKFKYRVQRLKHKTEYNGYMKS